MMPLWRNRSRYASTDGKTVPSLATDAPIEREVSSSPTDGELRVVTEATARSVPGILRTENGLPSVATTASGDSKGPTAALDEEHANGEVEAWGVGRRGCRPGGGLTFASRGGEHK